MNKPIGVIDSGVGGLTVVHELMRQLPKEKLIYLGDTLRCPYGPRPEHEVVQFTWDMVEFLLEKDVKMIVVACNTATAYTLKELQDHLSIPVVGVIQPGARAAIKNTKNNHVGIIGTEGTIRSNAYIEALQYIKSDLDINALACPLFVPMVEQGILSGLQAEEIVKESLQPLMRYKDDMDSLILGCTHYPLIREVIQKVLGPQVTLISSSEETARETSAILEFHQLLNTGNEQTNHQFYTTGELEIFTEITKSIFNSSIDNLQAVTIEKAVIARN
ncbi:glutamate racemase [Ornithinibacillus sp. L9]|uniref:Glutamate racemase n=1 Tax=Ornithinibacillus caprae TaxID=2678566 RepID=A0A6N8FBK5_9BACI|nr:glutamate racemase [Ornithinibacillus caprae]MUK86943.1 glutamate racemase [Ornithinibacillus caprae]